MRLLLAITLILLFLWLHKAQRNNNTVHGNPCEAVSMSEAAVSLLLSPLSLYSCLVSTLLGLALSVPALVLGSLHNSLLLLLAWPCCVASVCISLLLILLRGGLYLLHLALAVGVVAILILTQHKMADGDAAHEKALHQREKLERRHTKATLRMFGCAVGQRW